MSYIAILLTFGHKQLYTGPVLGAVPSSGSPRQRQCHRHGRIGHLVTTASSGGWAVYYFLLVPMHLEYPELTFILVTPAWYSSWRWSSRNISPALYQALASTFSITTNCAVRIAIINITNSYNVMESFTAGFATVPVSRSPSC